MANKKNIWCILITVLAFGLLLTGCPTETTEDNPFKGTWKATEGEWTITFSNDTFEIPGMAKGTYTRDGNTATLTPTHVWSETTWVAADNTSAEPVTVTISGDTMTGGDLTFKKQ